MTAFELSKKYKLRRAVRDSKRPPRIPRNLKTKFSQRTSQGGKAKARMAMKKWLSAEPAPQPSKTKVSIVGRVPTARDVAAFLEIRTAPSALAEAVQKHGLGLPEVVGLSWSLLAVHEYGLAKTQFQKSLAQAKKARLTPARRAEATKAIRAGWSTIVRGYVAAFASAGAKSVTSAKLDRASRALDRNQAAKREFLTMYKSGPQRAVRSAPRRLTASLISTGAFQNLADLPVFFRPGWCGFEPLTGSFTKHWGADFEIRGDISYPCGIKFCKIWGIPYPCGLKWCKKSVVLIGGSISFTLDVGYEIDCCGASAWGSATVEACGTLLGGTVCVTCQAAVAGVAGVGNKWTQGTTCFYGLGVTVSAECRIAGYKVFDGSKRYPWLVQGPCPPFGLCA